MEDDKNDQQSLQSKIESAVSKITGVSGKPENSADSAGNESSSWLRIFSSFFNGLGVGLLLGLLLGLAVSPVVSVIIGTISSLLAVLLGLNENYLNPVKSIRIGSFGLFCVVGILSGIYIRSHNLLAPSLQSLYSEYRAMGFSDKDSRNFIAYQEFNLTPESWTKIDTAKAIKQPMAEISEHKLVVSGENIASKKRQSVLYSSEVDAGKCYILESSSEKMSFSDLKMNFVVAGGTWKELATALDTGLPESVRKKTLLLLRDIFCAAGGSENVKMKCNNLQDLNEQSSLENIRKSLSASDEIWNKIVAETDKKIEAEYQKQLYLSLIKILCHD
jgi:hypothetical protein